MRNDEKSARTYKKGVKSEWRKKVKQSFLGIILKKGHSATKVVPAFVLYY